ncbi:MAG: Rrf2 family transcriptional regulator [Elusimicrobia bacterium]|jgi:Rrf2 family protein|nr:Rrf2 family transcriptional regulator [Elusimicrobiota bacterium]
MRVTAMQEYGLRCMLQIAAHKLPSPLPVREIARREHLTPVYVEKILVNLRRAGLVKSLRGVNGGYIMAGKPADISVGAVLSALGQVDLGKDLCRRFTGNTSTCVHTGGCSIRPIWGLLTRYIYGFLEKINLEQLLKEEARVVEDINEIGTQATHSMGEKVVS